MKAVVLENGTLTTKDYPKNIFSGFITAKGLSDANKLPLGWSVRKPFDGHYRILHNLNLGINKDLRITATLFGNTPLANRIYVKGIGTNGFIIETDSNGILVPSAFFFTAILI